ncbi:MAG: glycosyltransferase family 2 protein [Rhodospirillales bacterium]|nr:glycosyltransferase family 2 protein [Rhodospirillales bacterium]
MRHLAGAAHPPGCAYDADVIILSLGRVAETERAIASALAQRGVALHVTVLDQGSDPAALARLARAVAGQARVSLYGADENLGVAGGRNRASALGHGRVIFGLDNDARFAAPDTLARAVAALDGAPELAAIGLRILAEATGGDDLHSWGYPRALLARAGEVFESVTFVGAGHAIRRAAFAALGGYDEALFFCWEEYDFSLRAIAAGWTIRYRGDIAVRHRLSQEGRVAWSGRRWFYFTRNRLYIARKWRQSWLALAPRIALYLLRGLIQGGGGLARPGQILRALPAAARMARDVVPAAPAPPMLAYLAAHERAYRPLWARAVP